MYLSRLLLNPLSRQVQRETADPYNLHRTILKAFDDNRQAANVLHRLETNGRLGNVMLLVQSEAKPNWQPLMENGYLLSDDSFWDLPNPAVKQVHISLREGQLLRFRLCANPTIKKVRRDENGKRRNSNRVPLVREAKQLEWLQSKAELHGFRLLDADVGQAKKHMSYKRGSGGSITLYTVVFNGRLQITDSKAFETAVCQGIGPAKAFGCGLLSLAPA